MQDGNLVDDRSDSTNPVSTRNESKSRVNGRDVESSPPGRSELALRCSSNGSNLLWTNLSALDAWMNDNFLSIETFLSGATATTHIEWGGVLQSSIHGQLRSFERGHIPWVIQS